jgi:hypothetical protein
MCRRVSPLKQGINEAHSRRTSTSAKCTSKASDEEKSWSSTDDDAAAPILIFVIACLILAVLILRSPDTVVLTADQISLMPLWGP